MWYKHWLNVYAHWCDTCSPEASWISDENKHLRSSPLSKSHVTELPTLPPEDLRDPLERKLSLKTRAAFVRNDTTDYMWSAPARRLPCSVPKSPITISLLWHRNPTLDICPHWQEAFVDLVLIYMGMFRQDGNSEKSTWTGSTAYTNKNVFCLLTRFVDKIGIGERGRITMMCFQESVLIYKTSLKGMFKGEEEDKNWSPAGLSDKDPVVPGALSLRWTTTRLGDNGEEENSAHNAD